MWRSLGISVSFFPTSWSTRFAIILLTGSQIKRFYQQIEKLTIFRFDRFDTKFAVSTKSCSNKLTTPTGKASLLIFVITSAKEQEKGSLRGCLCCLPWLEIFRDGGCAFVCKFVVYSNLHDSIQSVQRPFPLSCTVHFYVPQACFLASDNVFSE